MLGFAALSKLGGRFISDEYDVVVGGPDEAEEAWSFQHGHFYALDGGRSYSTKKFPSSSVGMSPSFAFAASLTLVVRY